MQTIALYIRDVTSTGPDSDKEYGLMVKEAAKTPQDPVQTLHIALKALGFDPSGVSTEGKPRVAPKETSKAAAKPKTSLRAQIAR